MPKPSALKKAKKFSQRKGSLWSNAVYHATGVRVRDLPIRLEKLMSV